MSSSSSSNTTRAPWGITLTEVRAAHQAALPTRIRIPAQPETPAVPCFAVGDTVMHPSEGICTVSEIRMMQFSGAARNYYVLKPETDRSSSTVYMPVSRGNSVLRRLLTRSDIDTLIAQSRTLPSLWIEDAKQRRDVFHAALASGDYAKIIRMVADIYEHNALRLAEGKKPCSTDEWIREEAENMMHQEFSHVLGLSGKETIAYIRARMD